MAATCLIKRIAAFGLCASFFLPLAQCSQKSGGASPPLTISAYSAYGWPSVGSALVALLFLWPMAVQLISLVRKRQKSKRAASFVEAGMGLLSISGISWLSIPWIVAFGASMRFGSLAAYGSAAAYCIASLAEGMTDRKST